jgi:hypothetical protein
MYRPLPSSLTIKPSGVHGLGLFATSDIATSCTLGKTHVFDASFDNGYIRTPLGGFINHSDQPNCGLRNAENGRYKLLYTLRDILAGEELMVKYSLYTVVPID